MSEAPTVTGAVERIDADLLLPVNASSVTLLGMARVRDIPASCICRWLWKVKLRRWELFQMRSGCPWHTPGDRS
jgi:hypothetical protein